MTDMDRRLFDYGQQLDRNCPPVTLEEIHRFAVGTVVESVNEQGRSGANDTGTRRLVWSRSRKIAAAGAAAAAVVAIAISVTSFGEDPAEKIVTDETQPPVVTTTAPQPSVAPDPTIQPTTSVVSDPAGPPPTVPDLSNLPPGQEFDPELRAGEVFMDFSSNPNWTSIDSTSEGNDFGYRLSDIAGGLAGEIGGFFDPMSATGWIGDPTVGPFKSNDDIAASGLINLRSVDADFGGSVVIGHFDSRQTKHGLGIQIVSTGPEDLAVFSLVGGTQELLFRAIGVDTQRWWSYRYDPDDASITFAVSGGGGGTITVLVETEADGPPGFPAVDTYGILVPSHPPGQNTDDAGQRIELYIDNVIYTVAGPASQRIRVDQLDSDRATPEIPTADRSGTAQTFATPVPDVENALAGDDGSPRQPLGAVTELPQEAHLDFLNVVCDPFRVDDCNRDAVFRTEGTGPEGSGSWSADEPFHVRHGFVNLSSTPLDVSFDVVLYLTQFWDGNEGGETIRYTSDFVLRGLADSCGPSLRKQTGPVTCEWFVHDFPEGLPAGRWAMWAVWVAPCWAWVDLGFTNGCADPNEVMSFFASGVDSPFL